EGRFEITGRANILSPYDSQLRHEVDADLTTVRYPQAGIRIGDDRWGAIGVVYRGQTQLRLGIPTHLQGVLTLAGVDVPLLYELETHTVTGFLPQQVVFGATLSRIRNVHLNIDVTWMNWAAFESPTAETTAHLRAKPPPGAPIQLPSDLKPVEIVPLEFE